MLINFKTWVDKLLEKHVSKLAKEIENLNSFTSTEQIESITKNIIRNFIPKLDDFYQTILMNVDIKILDNISKLSLILYKHIQCN